ncbi:hypothetical protein Lalb_Chr10g0091831 [Lupinus albus]|uniref:Uncharacterized protein n=1 Tax=Lupinus albus TaxID=3870 RepID=A0A6A4PTG3_LUPAL|nr:hypothetical protein Lalb_Chr10g0091831 [Lupinus albus]
MINYIYLFTYYLGFACYFCVTENIFSRSNLFVTFLVENLLKRKHFLWGKLTLFWVFLFHEAYFMFFSHAKLIFVSITFSLP